MPSQTGFTAHPGLHAHARACGKIILLGEHSVVYGHPALAAGLARGLELSATPLASSRDAIELAIPAWELELRLEPGSEHPVARACLEVLAYCDGPVTGWRIVGASRIPSRAGLGSSAALSVALARLVLGPDAAIEELVAASMTGERIFHGNPSGIDSEVAARGGVIAFQRVGGQATIESVRLREPLHLVVLPTGVPRQTSALVGRVRVRRDRLPSVIDPVLDALGALARRARTALEQGDPACLAELVTVAHPLLGALDVGHPALDRACAAACAAGASAAKLTGAGGGGCAYALCESEAHAAQVLANLERVGQPAFAVVVDP